MARALGHDVTSALPVSPPSDGDVTALTRHARRGTGFPLPRGARAEPARCEWRTRGQRSPSVAPIPGFSQAGAWETRKGSAAAPPRLGARPERLGLRRGPGCPGTVPRSARPLPPRGLGAAARDVQTQLSAGARDSRIAFGQSGAAARDGERSAPEAPGMETPRGSGDTRWGGPLRGG